MLVLSRRELESVVITYPSGQQVTVTVYEIERGKVRLAFQAPPEVEIIRSELLSPKKV